MDKNDLMKLFLSNKPNSGISGLWLMNIDKNDNNQLDHIPNEKFILMLRKVVFKPFSGKANELQYSNANISVAPDIKLENKISLDFNENDKGDIERSVFKYLRMVIPTHQRNEFIFSLDINSLFFNSWINFFNKLKLYHFLDPIKRYKGNYWEFDFEDLKLDGSSGILNREKTFDYSFNLINNDLNLYFNIVNVYYNDVENDTRENIFHIDFREQINWLNTNTFKK